MFDAPAPEWRSLEAAFTRLAPKRHQKGLLSIIDHGIIIAIGRSARVPSKAFRLSLKGIGPELERAFGNSISPGSPLLVINGRQDLKEESRCARLS